MHDCVSAGQVDSGGQAWRTVAGTDTAALSSLLQFILNMRLDYRIAWLLCMFKANHSSLPDYDDTDRPDRGSFLWQNSFLMLVHGCFFCEVFLLSL